MTSTVAKTPCAICGKGKVMYKCEGCQQSFCLNHLNDHNRQLAQQLDDLEDRRNLFKQTLNQYQQHSSEHPFLQQIDQWEQNSICLIQQTAQEAREILRMFTTEHMTNVEIRLNKLTNEMKELRNENDFNEIYLNELKTKLDELQGQLHQPDGIQIEADPILVKKIDVIISSSKVIFTFWNPNAVTVAGGIREGQRLNQLFNPYGIAIVDDDDQTIYVADMSNHRIVEWKRGETQGRVVAGGNGQGNRTNQLNNPINVIIDHQNDALIIADYDNRRVVRWPRQYGQSGQILISNVRCSGLAMNLNGHLYLSDEDKDEVRRWKRGDKEGTLVAGGNGRGNRLNQFNQPRYIFVDENESIYVSDWGNDRVIKWSKGSKEGIIVAGGQGEGNSLRQLASPEGIFVDQMETVYVADWGNNRIIRWFKGSKEGEIVIGGNGPGNQPNQLRVPIGLSFDKENNLYVADYGNHRIQKFLTVLKK